MNDYEDLQGYEAFLSLTEKMYENVRDNDWTGIAQVTQDRERSLRTLRKEESVQNLMAENPNRKVHLMQKILSLNGQIREMIQSKMATMEKQFQTEKLLLRSYGIQAGD